jgi:hypothetical protein
MNQKVSWPIALAVVAVLLVLLLALYRGSGLGGGSDARISPGFQQLSPAEQKAALSAAAGARMRRGAPPQGR